jgi:Holliday junction resolvasome RuvABC endonuclease subunit
VSLAELTKTKAHRVLGVDASTNSIAFCIFEDGKVVSYGEIFFEGASVYERILDAKRKMSALKKQQFFDVDFMAIEAGVMVKSVHIGIKMAYVFGAIMGEILDDNIKVIEVHPITWQSYLGNKNYTRQQKEAIRNEFPGKSDNWIKAKIRERRKDYTLDFVKSLGVNVVSDNVADAAGIGWYTVNNLTEYQ